MSNNNTPSSDALKALHELSTAVRFASHGIKPTDDEAAEFKLALVAIRAFISGAPDAANAGEPCRHADVCNEEGLCANGCADRAPVAYLRSITHPDWLETCDKDAPGAFPVFATPTGVAADESTRAPDGWRCFHCDEAFTDEAAAAEHFGTRLMQNPACTIDIAEYRRMEETHRRHCEDDADLHREIYRLQCEHTQALQREEEKGYARGLRDGVNLPADSPERASLMASGERPSTPVGSPEPLTGTEPDRLRDGMGGGA